MNSDFRKVVLIAGIVTLTLVFIAACGGAGSGSGGIGANQSYTVTYEVGLATGGTPPEDTTEYKTGDMVTVLGNPGGLSASGLTFVGWNAVVDTDAAQYSEGETFSMGASNVTLSPVWDSGVDNMVTLTFYSEDSSLLPTQVFVDDQYIGCISDTGESNGITANVNYYKWYYLKAKHGNGMYRWGIGDPQTKADPVSLSPVDVSFEFAKEGTYGGLEVAPDGGWEPGCGGDGTLLGYGYSMEILGALHVREEGLDLDRGTIFISANDFSSEFIFVVNTAGTEGVASGTYNLNLGSLAIGDLAGVIMITGRNSEGSVATAAASTQYASKAAYESTEGITLVGAYGQITGGSITVDRSGNDYTVSWNLTTAEGDSIGGSFSGTDAL